MEETRDLQRLYTFFQGVIYLSVAWEFCLFFVADKHIVPLVIENILLRFQSMPLYRDLLYSKLFTFFLILIVAIGTKARKDIELEITIIDGQLDGREEEIANGLLSHFEYREWQTDRQLRKLFREGRISLVIGIAALAGFNAVSRVIGSSSNPVVEVIHEGFVVLGWVSMWKPLEILLYDWWPIRHERRACQRLADATITFAGT